MLASVLLRGLFFTAHHVQMRSLPSTRSQSRRHTRTHTRFTCRRCEYICSTHAEMATHIAATSTQTGPAGSSLATLVLTPTKHRAKRVITYAAYKAVKIEDPLGILKSSDEESKLSNDPRADQFSQVELRHEE